MDFPEQRWRLQRPILSFLTRSSDSITPLRGLAIATSLFLGPVLISAAQGMDDHTSATSKNVVLSSNIAMTVAPALFVLSVGESVVRQWWRGTGGTAAGEDVTAQSERRFRTVVMGTHMTTCICCMLIETVWFWYNGVTTLSAETLSIFLYLSVASSIIVFVVEIRVRKNEFLQGAHFAWGSSYAMFTSLFLFASSRSSALYNTMEAKRTYVRYVSHELRTPMNAAFLGLKLVTDQLQHSTTPRDRDIYEVLHDVQLACNTSVEVRWWPAGWRAGGAPLIRSRTFLPLYAAVQILNDLLSFEKLEGGILDLHAQEVPVLRFLTETLRQFSGQVRFMFLCVPQLWTAPLRS